MSGGHGRESTGLLGGLTDLMDFAVRLAREGEIDGIHEVAFGKSRAVLGFSVKEGLNGSRRTPRLGQTPVAKGEAPREPFVDIFDEGHEYLRVIAEMPGIDPQNVMVKAEGDLLTMEAKGEYVWYQGTFHLPCLVEGVESDRKYQNGILECCLRKETSS